MLFKHKTALGRAMFYTGMALLVAALAGLLALRVMDNVSVTFVVIVVAALAAGIALMFTSGRPESRFVHQRFAQWVQGQGLEPTEQLDPAHVALIDRVLTDKERALPTAQDVRHSAAGRVGHRKVSVAVVQHNFKSDEIDGVQVTSSPVKVTVTYIAWIVELARMVPDVRIASEVSPHAPGTAYGDGLPEISIAVESPHEHLVTPAVRAALLDTGEPWSAVVTTGTTMMLYTYGMRIMNRASAGDTSYAEAELAKAIAVAQALDAATDTP